MRGRAAGWGWRRHSVREHLLEFDSRWRPVEDVRLFHASVRTGQKQSLPFDYLEVGLHSGGLIVYARYIVGWRVGGTAHASRVLDALDQAIHDRGLSTVVA